MPVFGIGITSASFQLSGKRPEFSDKLNRWVTSRSRTQKDSLRIKLLMLVIPDDLDTLISLTILKTSVSRKGSKEFNSGAGLNKSSPSVGLLSASPDSAFGARHLFSIFPTLMKKSLMKCATSSFPILEPLYLRSTS